MVKTQVFYLVDIEYLGIYVYITQQRRLAWITYTGFYLWLVYLHTHYVCAPYSVTLDRLVFSLNVWILNNIRGGYPSLNRSVNT